ncbi:hypothetical protein RND71_000199 [Anisodus tanguticus]|uniref:Uncharacterized protein n=1 Tax=Anisodus tanguticus TaxID=243964 RepID=A0AAE1VR40_9SOLA|nr:hypothetical protein RND71_000199 [Anisodus tanguticus]
MQDSVVRAVHKSLKKGEVSYIRPSLESKKGAADYPCANRDAYITKEGEKTQKPFISRSFLAAKEEVPRPGMLTPYLRENDTFLLDAPSTSRKLLPEFGGEEFQKIPGGSFIRLLKNESSPSQVTESKELHHRSYDQQKLPHPLLDLETMRTSNTKDP